MIEKEVRVNTKIQAIQVRLIGANGEQMGIVPTKEAIRIAEEQGLDLVEVAPQSQPPVCRIMDYGKYRYEKSKRAKEAKKRQHGVRLKEIQISPKIEEHDYQFKTRNARNFLLSHNKVKITVIFRGREISYTEVGTRMLDRMAADLSEVSVVEQQPRLEGKNMVMVLAPK